MQYFVQHFAYIIASDWFEDTKEQVFCQKTIFGQFKKWFHDHRNP